MAIRKGFLISKIYNKSSQVRCRCVDQAVTPLLSLLIVLKL